MAKIVIIGAGLTGISAAYHLEKKGFYDYQLFEKEATIGGLCRSVVHNGFTFDYTGHLLHINDPYFHTLIQDVVGFDHLQSIARRSAIYSHGIYSRYPYQINLFGLPSSVISDCIAGFVTRKKSRAKLMSFPAWVHHNFGAGFAKHFFFPYQSKLFGYDLDKICASWTGRFVPATSLEKIIQGATTDMQDPIGYNAHLYYPKQGGIFYWIEKLAAALKQPIRTQHEVKSIDMRTKTILFTNGHHEQYEQLINTMPLDRLLNTIEDRPSTSVKTAASKLLCNAVVSVNMGVKTQLPSVHWAYYPEKQYPFYRIGFPHNLTPSVAPAGCSSLIGEFAHLHKPRAWVQAKTKQTKEHIKKLFTINDEEILMEHIMHIDHAYVIYDFWREKNLPKIHARLHEQSIYSVGRYGEWKYSSMQEGVLDGKQIADALTIMPARRVECATTITAQHSEHTKTIKKDTHDRIV